MTDIVWAQVILLYLSSLHLTNNFYLFLGSMFVITMLQPQNSNPHPNDNTRCIPHHQQPSTCLPASCAPAHEVDCKWGWGLWWQCDNNNNYYVISMGNANTSTNTNTKCQHQWKTQHQWQLVFESPVHATGKKLQLNQTELQSGCGCQEFLYYSELTKVSSNWLQLQPVYNQITSI